VGKVELGFQDDHVQLQLLIVDNVGDVAEWGQFIIWFLATVLAMVLETMLSRIWEEE
jgi:hypothetical protein